MYCAFNTEIPNPWPAINLESGQGPNLCRKNSIISNYFVIILIYVKILNSKYF